MIVFHKLFQRKEGIEMIVDLFLYFSIYSFMGWVLETVFASFNHKKFINRGFLIGPFTPIYGFGAILIILFSKWIEQIFENYYLSLLISIVISTLLVTVLEFITGYVLEKVFHEKWWDYSNNALNLKGYVCLKYSLLWGGLAFILIQVIHPFVEQFVYIIPWAFKTYISIILAAYFLFDTYKSVKGTLHLRKAILNYSDLPLGKYKEIILKYERIFHAFPNLLMLNADILNREVKEIINERIHKIKLEIKNKLNS